MYGFHYSHIKKKYGDRAQLLFTDTDSLCYNIQTKDFHDDIRNDVPTMYEAGGRQIKEFVGLRSKLYAFKIHGYDTMCDNVQYTESCGKPSRALRNPSLKGNGNKIFYCLIWKTLQNNI